MTEAKGPIRVLAVTGHRPEKLGGHGNHARVRRFAEAQLSSIRPALLITGMALGWDTACAEAAVELGIPFLAAVPFPQQPSRWPLPDIRRWRGLLEKAQEVVYVSKEYSGEAFQRRNIWMVDNSTHLLALWNGSSGGTRNCWRYAERLGRERENCWKGWEAVQ